LSKHDTTFDVLLINHFRQSRRPRTFVTNIVLDNHSCNQPYPADL
jgi:hypothetical protein